MTTVPQTHTSVLSPARDLELLFAPRSIAVIGASRKVGTVGNAVFRNLITKEFTGVVYPVNPKAKSILAVQCIKNITEVGEPVDLAAVIVPSPYVQQVVEQCADMGTKNFVVLSAGFKEVGGEGVKREQRLKDMARERGLAILGPNCLGVINTDPEVSMNCSFGREMPVAGSIGLISQSGALCASLLDYAKGRDVGFSRFVSFGNKVDLSEVDLLRSLGQDDKTKAILMYVEDIGDGQAFLEAAYDITHGENPKPIIAIKTGRTEQGSAAAASHTGAMAGQDEFYSAMMEQAGVIRVDSVGELFDMASGFLDPVLPKGNRTAIVTNAGGPGVMATDACIRADLKLAKFREYTIKSLKYQLPSTASINNPVDVIGDATHRRYRAALDAVAADDTVDQILVIVTPQTMTDVLEIARVIGEIREFSNKPIVACLMGLVDVSAGLSLLTEKYNVPAYTFPESAVRALSAKTRFAKWSKQAEYPYRQFEVDKKSAQKLIASELAAGRHQLIEYTALQLLDYYGISTVPYKLAATADEAVTAAGEFGYPVVLKISSPDVLHKTEANGVILNLDSGEAVREAFERIVASAYEKVGKDIDVWGVLVQKMLDPGKEVILGVTRDAIFGPMVMAGLGGIYAEVLKDAQFRMAPMREDVPRHMLEQLRTVALLKGVRGEKPSDIDAVCECLLRLSQLVTDIPLINELDINPLMVYASGSGAMAADARIILSTKASE